MDNEYSLAILKGFIASIPLVGSFTVEILNVAIPNQRQKRVEKLLKILGEQVSDLHRTQLEQKFVSTDFIDIFEDVLHQSIRATSDKRLEYLASVINYGLRREELEHLQTKRLLKILAEINDVEVIILESYSYSSIMEKKEFGNEYSSIFHPSHDSDEKSESHEAMLKNYTSNLVNLGLVGGSNFFGSSHLLITRLGVMLLEEIGIWKGREVFQTGKHINPIDAINTAHDNLKKTEERVRREIEMETKKGVKTVEDAMRRIIR